jgi:site-specific DNA-methyltransferase (adenine-specific)
MAFEVMSAWGFAYHSLGFDWLKVSKGRNPIINPGYYTRQNNELCLVGVPEDRDRRMKPIVHDVRAAVVEERREHSRKPEIVRTEIARLFGVGFAKIELFARERVAGWDAWGDQLPTEGGTSQ